MLDQVIAEIGAYIESASSGDERKILAAGVGVRALAATRDITAPAAFSLTEGDHNRELKAHWDRVENARSYVLERSLDPPTETSWVHEKVVTTSSTTIAA